MRAIGAARLYSVSVTVRIRNTAMPIPGYISRAVRLGTQLLHDAGRQCIGTSVLAGRTRQPYCAIPTITSTTATPAISSANVIIRNAKRYGDPVDSKQWDQRYSGTAYEWSTRPNQFVESELAGLVPGRALDLASGEGRNSVWLATCGWRVTGVDFSAVGLEKGRRLAADHGVSVDWVHADLRDYVPDPGAFDLVVIAYLQLPWDELQPVLGRAAGALAPGGMLFIVGHDVLNLTEGIGGPQDPSVLYTPERLTSALSDLTVTRSGQVRRQVSATASAVDTVVTATRLTRRGNRG
jgi:SAM-dependent methyltransferase